MSISKLTLAAAVLLLLAPQARSQTANSIYPQSAAPGNLLIITGLGFGESKGGAALMPISGGRRLPLKIEYWSETSIHARLPAKKTKPDHFLVSLKRRGGNYQNSILPFEVIAPSVAGTDKRALCLGLAAIEGIGFGPHPKLTLLDRRRRKIKGVKTVRIETFQGPSGPMERVVVRLPKRAGNGDQTLVLKTYTGKVSILDTWLVQGNELGAARFRATGGSVNLKADVGPGWPAGVLFLDENGAAGGRLELSGFASGGRGGFFLAIPGFQSCAGSATYTVNGADGQMAFNAGDANGVFLTIAPGAPGFIQVRMTGIGGGQVGGRFSGWTTQFDLSVDPPVVSAVDVSGSFVVNLRDAIYPQ